MAGSRIAEARSKVARPLNLVPVRNSGLSLREVRSCEVAVPVMIRARRVFDLQSPHRTEQQFSDRFGTALPLPT